MKQPELHTAPVVDGMIINVGDFAQNVKVRAKSLGPAFCAVRFTAGNSSPFELMAPPLIWGGGRKFHTD